MGNTADFARMTATECLNLVRLRPGGITYVRPNKGIVRIMPGGFVVKQKTRSHGCMDTKQFYSGIQEVKV